MRLESRKLPPVSTEFFERLIVAFPPLEASYVSPDRSLIDIQRRAAQQEVINYIAHAVTGEAPPATEAEQPRITWRDRIRAVFSSIMEKLCLK